MKLLGVDYGTKRIGLATGDTEMSLALPLRSVATFEEVVAAAREESADRVVVGMPRSMTDAGIAGERAILVKAFIERLRMVLALPIETEDERMTTAMVEHMRRDAGVKKKDFDADAAAATAILETYLERMKSR